MRTKKKVRINFPLTITILAILLSADAVAQECNAPETLMERWYLPKNELPKRFDIDPFRYSPQLMYQKAHEEFEACRREESGYWMYLGQLRYRALLECIEEGVLEKRLTPFGTDFRKDEFVALQSDIGLYINEWLGGDIQLWIDTIERAKNSYSQGVSDKIIPASSCRSARAKALSGMLDLQTLLVENVEDFRRQRAKNELENRTDGAVSLPD